VEVPSGVDLNAELPLATVTDISIFAATKSEEEKGRERGNL
jgi:hypothetical protein